MNDVGPPARGFLFFLIYVPLPVVPSPCAHIAMPDRLEAE